VKYRVYMHEAGSWCSMAHT